MTEKLETTVQFGKHHGRTVRVRTNDLDQSVTLAIPDVNRVNVGVDFPYEDVAALLGRDLLERMIQMVRRQERFSGVECLDDIDGSAVSLDDYADATENGVRPRPFSARTDAVEVKCRHLRTLHQAAQTYASPSVRRALEETEHLV